MLKVDVGVVVLVQEGKAVVPAYVVSMENSISNGSRSREEQNILGVSMGSVWYRSQRGQIVNPVKMRLLCDWIDASEEQVDCVGAS